MVLVLMGCGNGAVDPVSSTKTTQSTTPISSESVPSPTPDSPESLPLTTPECEVAEAEVKAQEKEQNETVSRIKTSYELVGEGEGSTA